jgi:acyl-CoA thioester hydrolase
MKYDFSSKCLLRVRYGETDQMGYAYYGVYAQYFEVGRVEALRELGMTYRSMEEKGIMLPVSEFNVRYKAPARYDDAITVQTTISSVEGARIRFDYCLLDDHQKILAEAYTTLVFVRKDTMKPTAPPDDFMQLIQSYASK